MIKTRHLVFVFVPAIAVVALVFFIRVAQYEPLYPDYSTPETDNPNSDNSFVPIFSDDPILGSKKAGKTIIAFEDLTCAACRQQMQIFRTLLEKHPNRIKIIWKGLPVSELPYPSAPAHAYAYCAGQQNKFAQFEKEISQTEGPYDSNTLIAIASQSDLDQGLLDICLNSGAPETYQEKTEELAKNVGVAALPTVFVDGEQIDAALTVTGWESFLKL